MEVICIDGKFAPRSIELIPNRPAEGHIGMIRDVQNLPDGRIGIWLDNIHNPEIELDFRPGFLIEPTFNIERFRHLDGTQITLKELKVLSKQIQDQEIDV